MTDRQLDRWWAVYWRKVERCDEAWQRYRSRLLADTPLTGQELWAKRREFDERFWSPERPRRLSLQLAACRYARSRQTRREQWRRRRERILNSPVSVIDRKEIYRRDRGRCGICGRDVLRKKMVLDHVVPLKRGGQHTDDNLRVAHRICNGVKGTRLRVNFWCMKCLRRWPRRGRTYSSSCVCGARWYANVNNRRHWIRTPDMLDTLMRRRS